MSRGKKLSHEDFASMTNGTWGEDSIEELAAAQLTEAQRKIVEDYIWSHISNRNESGMDVPEWMEAAHTKVYRN